jgi:hypothetical protein
MATRMVASRRFKQYVTESRREPRYRSKMAAGDQREGLFRANSYVLCAIFGLGALYVGYRGVRQLVSFALLLPRPEVTSPSGI